MSELSVSPGTSTTMYWLPWVVTSASLKPVALTRLSMMEAASSRFSWLGLPLAVRVIRVPPWRSSPRAGFQVPPMATRPKITAIPIAKTTNVRPAWAAALRAMSALLLRTGAVGVRLVVLRLEGLVLVLVDLAADRAARDLDHDALGDLDQDVVVRDLAHGGVDARRQHDLLVHVQRGLHAPEFLLPSRLRPDDEEPEEQHDADERQELHDEKTSRAESRGVGALGGPTDGQV